MLNLFPLRRAKLTSYIDSPGPLARVTIDELRTDTKLTQKDLSAEDHVVYNFLRQQYLRCFQIAPDEKFLQYLQFLERSFDVNNVHELCYMLLTCVSLPNYINAFSFLVKQDKHQL